MRQNNSYGMTTLWFPSYQQEVLRVETIIWMRKYYRLVQIETKSIPIGNWILVTGIVCVEGVVIVIWSFCRVRIVLMRRSGTFLKIRQLILRFWRTQSLRSGTVCTRRCLLLGEHVGANTFIWYSSLSLSLSEWYFLTSIINSLLVIYIFACSRRPARLMRHRALPVKKRRRSRPADAEGDEGGPDPPVPFMTPADDDDASSHDYSYRPTGHNKMRWMRALNIFNRFSTHL